MRGDWVEIPKTDITLQEKLGEGTFGEAYRGLVRIDRKVRECAVKKLKGKQIIFICVGRTEDTKSLFLKLFCIATCRIMNPKLF